MAKDYIVKKHKQTGLSYKFDPVSMENLGLANEEPEAFVIKKHKTTGISYKFDKNTMENLGPVEDGQSGVEKFARGAGGLVADIAISEGLPIAAGLGASTVATPVGGVAAYLATRGGAGALGSVARQKIINPDESLNKAELVSDAVINTIPILGKGKTVARTIGKRSLQGAGIGATGYGIETALDSEKKFDLTEASIRTGLGGVLGAAPDTIGALRNRNKQGVQVVSDNIAKDKSLQTGGVIPPEKFTETIATGEDISKLDTATQIINKGGVEDAIKPVDIEINNNIRKQVLEKPIGESVDIETPKGLVNVNKKTSDIVDLDLDSETIGESLTKIDLKSITKAYGTYGVDIATLPKKERISHQENYINAQTRGLLETTEQQKMVKNILSGDKTSMDSAEAIGLMDYRRKVENKIAETDVKLNDALESGNLKDQMTYNIQANDLKRLQEDVLGASATLDSETGRTLNILNTGLKQEPTSLGGIKTTIESNLGRELTPQELAKYSKQTSRLKEVEVAREKILAELPKLEQEALVAEMSSLLKIKNIKVEDALVKIQEGKGILAKLGYQLNDISNSVAMSVEAANGVRKIAEGLIQSGQAKRDATDLMQKVQQIVPDVSEQDIYNSVGRRIKSYKSKQLIKQRSKLKELETQSNLLGRINELTGKAEEILKKQKTIYQDSPTIKKLRSELLSLSLQANRTVGHSKKLQTVQKDIQDITDMLEGKFRYLERYQGKTKPTEISPQLSKAYKERAVLSKELKAEDALFNLKLIEKEGEKFTPRQNKEKINSRTRRLNVEIKKIKAKNRENNKDFKKQEAFRIGRLEETLALSKQELSGDFRSIPVDKQAKLVSKYEQELLEELNETALLKKETDKIYQLNEQLRKQDLSIKPKNNIEVSERLEGLRLISKLLEEDLKLARKLTPENIAQVKKQRLENLNKRLDSYEKQLNEGWREYKVKSDELGLANDIDLNAVREKINSVQTQMKTQSKIDHLRERLRTKDFVEETPVVKSMEELSALDLEHSALKRQLHAAVWDSKHRRLAKAMKESLKGKQTWKEFKSNYKHLGYRDYLDAVWSWTNLPRELMATGDVSGLGRQGLWLGNKLFFEDQKAFWHSVNTAFANAVSPEKFDLLEAQLLRDPDYNKMVNAGLHFTEVTQAMDKAEEIFAGSLLDNVPVLGAVYRGSNRHMVTLLNLQRYHTMKNLMNKHPEMTGKTQELFANYINIASGRGDLGKLEGISKELSIGFFSPRFAASRFQLLSAPIFHKVKSLRSDDVAEKYARDLVAKESVKDMARLAATYMGVLAIASQHPDIEVGLDSESPDFGKILIGDHHIDISGGLLPTIRLLVDIPQGMLNWVGGEFEVQKPSKSAVKFMESKASPLYQIVSEALSNKGWDGRELESRSEILTNKMYPMVLEDVVKVFKGEEDAEDAVLSFGLNSVGISDNVY